MTALLEVTGVSVRFGGLLALDDVSLTVEAGRCTGLIGPNGAGKTTLFNVISGLQRPSAGSIGFRGRDLGPAPACERARRGIGRSFQNLGLMMDQTVEINVLAAQYPRTRYRPLDPIVRPWRWREEERHLARRMQGALDRFDLSAHRRELVGDLSFGKARFVELASVLVNEPDLLLLDEPTTGLDRVERAALLLALQRVRAEGRTILLIAHDTAFVMQLCDVIHVLVGGRVLSSGTPQQVRQDRRVVEAYLGVAS
jgi:branched-chain amino acid transport system ATP-binding protein